MAHRISVKTCWSTPLPLPGRLAMPQAIWNVAAAMGNVSFRLSAHNFHSSSCSHTQHLCSMRSRTLKALWSASNHWTCAAVWVLGVTYNMISK